MIDCHLFDERFAIFMNDLLRKASDAAVSAQKIMDSSVIDGLVRVFTK
jgi:hypothetical protein